MKMGKITNFKILLTAVFLALGGCSYINQIRDNMTYDYCSGGLIDICVNSKEYQKKHLEIFYSLSDYLKKIKKNNINKLTNLKQSKYYTKVYREYQLQFFPREKNIIFFHDRNSRENYLSMYPMLTVNYSLTSRKISLRDNYEYYSRNNFKKISSMFCRTKNIPDEIKEHFIIHELYSPISGGSQPIIFSESERNSNNYSSILEKQCVQSIDDMYIRFIDRYKNVNEKSVDSDDILFKTYDLKMKLGIFQNIKKNNFYKNAKVFLSNEITSPNVDISGNIFIPSFYLEKYDKNIIKSIILHELTHTLFENNHVVIKTLITEAISNNKKRKQALDKTRKLLKKISYEEDVDLEAINLIKNNNISVLKYLEMLEKAVPEENKKERLRVNMLKIFKNTKLCKNLISDVIKYKNILGYMEELKSYPYDKEYYSLYKMVYLINVFNLYSNREKECNLKIDKYISLSNKYKLQYMEKEEIITTKDPSIIVSFSEIYKAHIKVKGYK